jgi:hypothetical protein
MARKISRFQRGARSNPSAGDLLKLMSELISLREKVAQAELKDRSRQTLSKPNRLARPAARKAKLH